MRVCPLPATFVVPTVEQRAPKLQSLGSAFLHTETAKFGLLLHKATRATRSLKTALGGDERKQNHGDPVAPSAASSSPGVVCSWSVSAMRESFEEKVREVGAIGVRCCWKSVGNRIKEIAPTAFGAHRGKRDRRCAFYN